MSDPVWRKFRLLSNSLKIAIAAAVRAVGMGPADQPWTVQVHVIPVVISPAARPPDQIAGNDPAWIRVDVDVLPPALRALVEQLIVRLRALWTCQWRLVKHTEVGEKTRPAESRSTFPPLSSPQPQKRPFSALGASFGRCPPRGRV